MELISGEVILLVLGVGEDQKNDTVGDQVIIDDASATSFAAPLGGTPKLTEAATAWNQIARSRLREELNLKFENFRLGQ